MTNRVGGSVSVINPDEPTESSPVQLGGEPEGIAAASGFVFVSDSGGTPSCSSMTEAGGR